MENSYTSAWNKFWHAPLRAERLAFMRILVGAALLTQQLFEYLPNLEEFYGPHGIAPAGLLDRQQLEDWRWTMLIFNTDDSTTVHAVFWLWTLVTLAFTVGFFTRSTTVALWLLTMCFISRNPFILDSGDDTLQICIFLMMLSPSGRALSVDAWLRRRRGVETGPVFTVAWPVRLIQIQLCVIYGTTGLVKLAGPGGLLKPDGIGWFEGSWWDGTSVHYALNFLTLSRYSYASLPIPLWLTAPMTYIAVWWEALFPLLVCWRRTRKWALAFGILFHLGIWLTLAVGWFGLYMVALYAVWVPCDFWQRWLGDADPEPSSHG